MARMSSRIRITSPCLRRPWFSLRLDPQPGQIFVDCTVGARRPRAAAWPSASGRWPSDRPRLRCRDAGTGPAGTRPGCRSRWSHAPFDELAAVLRSHGISAVDGVLADLGVCSDQLDDAEPRVQLPSRRAIGYEARSISLASRPANCWPACREREIADLIFAFGEERFSRRIARRIVEARRTGCRKRPANWPPLFADACREAEASIDPATRTFQALRIAVNDELGALDRLLEQLPDCVKPGGRVGDHQLSFARRSASQAGVSNGRVDGLRRRSR